MSDELATDTYEAQLGVDTFNSHYYQENGPAEFISMRLNALCLIGGEYEAFKELLAEGVEYVGLTLMLGPAQESTPELEKQDKDFHEHFLRIEAHHLKHLAIEALLRLFLGHRGLPECPWMEISNNRGPGQFKEDVRRLIVEADQDELQSHVAEVFMAQPGDLESLSEEDQDVSLNLTALLRVLAGDWLDEAKSYNATKHGLTAVPGAAEFHVGPSLEEQTRIGYGDSLTHLSVGDWVDDERVWTLTTRWIQTKQALAAIEVVIRMLKALWGVARWRYGIADDGLRSTLSSSIFSVHNLREMGTGSAPEMHWNIVETKPPPAVP